MFHFLSNGGRSKMTTQRRHFHETRTGNIINSAHWTPNRMTGEYSGKLAVLHSLLTDHATQEYLNLSPSLLEQIEQKLNQLPPIASNAIDQVAANKRQRIFVDLTTSSPSSKSPPADKTMEENKSSTSFESKPQLSHGIRKRNISSQMRDLLQPTSSTSSSSSSSSPACNVLQLLTKKDGQTSTKNFFFLLQFS